MDRSARTTRCDMDTFSASTQSMRAFCHAIMCQLKSMLLIAILCTTGCGKTGYFKSDGSWHFGFYSGDGYETRKTHADNESFRILTDPDYACDNTHFFKHGYIIDGVDGATFQLLEGNRFARDANHVYFDCQYIVLGVDRNSFQPLHYPYARDKNGIYCATLRMNVEKPEEFKVLEIGDRGIECFYSTDDLVLRLGKEFAMSEVLYDPKSKDTRYCAVSTQSGKATDGVFIYEGPKRIRRAQ
ncbi:MAG: DKNYY domain-containing protein [Pirellulales bacterium]